MIVLEHYIWFGMFLFLIGLTGVILHRKNIILILMCIEIMLLAVNTNFIAYSRVMQDMIGEIFVFFILTVAAAESAIGLAIIVLIYRQSSNIDIANLQQLKG